MYWVPLLHEGAIWVKLVNDQELFAQYRVSVDDFGTFVPSR